MITVLASSELSRPSTTVKPRISIAHGFGCLHRLAVEAMALDCGC